MSSLVLGSRFLWRTHGGCAGRSRMRRPLRFGIELLEDRITPAVPTVTSVAPTSGPATGGTDVTVEGTNFVGPLTVYFGTTAIPGVTPGTPESLTVESPAGTGTVDVTVMTTGGTSPINRPADQFTYTASTAPVVSGVSPNSGPLAGGTPVTISGSNFTGATAVAFGTLAATGFTVNSGGMITVNSPMSLTPGPVDVTVTTPSGKSATSASDVFTYVAAPPTVTMVSPTSGPTTGMTPVTISGSNFTGATAVDFGATPAASFSVVNNMTITAVSPPGTGTVDVLVTGPGGTSTPSQADLFTYVVLVRPTVTAISPRSGPPNGGTLVTITGSGFSQPGAVSVSFGSNPATNVTVVNPNSITAVSPAGTGAVDVTVSISGLTSLTSPADVFTYTTSDGPRVTSVVRYGYHAQPTYIVITFNMALDPTSAQLASNYPVVGYQIVGLIGRPIPVKFATYNAMTDKVTLVFARRLILRKNYMLTINGTTSSGVKSINGLLLDGANTGQPGSNYVTLISQYNLAGSAGQRPVAAILRAKAKSLVDRVRLAVHSKYVYYSKPPGNRSRATAGRSL